MSKEKEYIGINTLFTKQTHSDLNEFLKTHKIKNITITQGLFLEIATKGYIRGESEGIFNFEEDVSQHIRGDI